MFSQCDLEYWMKDTGPAHDNTSWKTFVSKLFWNTPITKLWSRHKVLMDRLMHTHAYTHTSNCHCGNQILHYKTISLWFPFVKSYFCITQELTNLLYGQCVNYQFFYFQFLKCDLDHWAKDTVPAYNICLHLYKHSCKVILQSLNNWQSYDPD